MNVLTIFVFVLIIVLIYMVYKLMTNPTTTVSDLSDSSKTVVVPSSKTESNSTGNNNYGYSVWLYIDAWKTNGTSTNNKNILTRTTSDNVPLFQLHLHNTQNDLMLEMSNNSTDKPCVIRNVQLQKWINITMSVYGNTVDLYLDGKLVRTCIMTSMPASLSSSDQLYIGGGYNIDPQSPNTIIATPGDLQGFISNVVYNPDYFSPEEAWNIYSAGYSGAGMFNFLHSYKLNFSITNNNQTLGQFSI